MNFDLSDEQRLLGDTIDRLIERDYSFEQRGACLQEAGGWSRRFWGLLAEQGFLALPFDAAHGGLGYGPVETMLVMEALGRGLVVEPYLSTVVVAGSVLRTAAPDAVLDTLVPAIASGERVLTLAAFEKQARYDLAAVATTARADGDGFVLDGRKILVPHGDSADTIIIAAREAGGPRDRDGISLFLVDADAAGLTRHGYRTQDGVPAADLTLEQVRVGSGALLGEQGRGLPALELARDHAIAALAAEAVGAMQATLDMTVDYLGQRRQFGGPIGRFQALQHRAAEMLIEVEQARSMAILGALTVAESEARSRELLAVKHRIGRSGRLVGELAVQLHGGIGVSAEYAVGHYLRRLAMIDLSFGDSEHCLEALAA
ncbi:acyl-CoA dehydrogenase family protein [Algiphilus sp.]|uniref:acyl-CoA dehydrogenase family protein n=1 Tax=Algiphilus sp. TaxID=1872431 RepID=UPI003C622106